MDSGNYEYAKREQLIEAILADRVGNGWSLDGGTADTDMTAMALQALAPYNDEEHPKSNLQSKQHFTLLSGMQQNDGGFASFGTANSESAAQVVVALSALGLMPTQIPVL